MKHAFKLSTAAMIVLSLFPLAQAHAAWTGTIDGSGGTGATAADGTVGNTLNIKAGAVINEETNAATNSWDDAGNAAFKDITLNITGGTIKKTVYGARSWLGHGDGITVSMTGGEVQGGTITGFEALLSDNVDVSNVLVTVSGGTFTKGSELYGASRVGNASNITVRLDGGTFTNTDRIAGAFYIHGKAENVLLEVNDGVTIVNDQTWPSVSLAAANITSKGTSRKAVLRINGGRISSHDSNGSRSGYVVGTVLDGAYGPGFTVENSLLEINGGSIEVSKVAGFYYDDAYTAKSISNTAVVVNGGEVTADSISGAYLYAKGQSTESASVTINDGTISTKGIYGALHSTSATEQVSTVGETTVTINGGDFKSLNADDKPITVAGSAKDDGTLGIIVADKSTINLNAASHKEGLDLSVLTVTKGNVTEGLLNVSGNVKGLDSVNDFEVLTIAQDSSLAVKNETASVDKIVVMENSSFETNTLTPADANTPIEIHLADTTAADGGPKVKTTDEFKGKVNLTGGGAVADSSGTAAGAVENMLDALDLGGDAKDVVGSITVEEGELAPGFEATPDGEGGFTVEEGGPNTHQDAYRSVRVLNLATLRHETNDLSKRMGELRLSPSGVGSWARIYGTEMEYGSQNLTTRNTSVQIGTDVDVGAGWKAGAAYSYTKSDFSGGANDGESDLHTAGVYAAWMGESGRFADFMLKAGKLSTDFSLNGYDGTYDNFVVIASAEYGRLFKPAERLFVEPQAELTWAWVEGDDFRAGRSVTVHQDDYQSLIGRVGVRAGLEFPNDKGTFYARVSGAWEMMGEDEYRAVTDAGRAESFRTELDGGWIEYAVGANFRLAPNAYVWADLEKSAGGDIRENYRYTIGARYVW